MDSDAPHETGTLVRLLEDVVYEFATETRRYPAGSILRIRQVYQDYGFLSYGALTWSNRPERIEVMHDVVRTLRPLELLALQAGGE